MGGGRRVRGGVGGEQGGGGACAARCGAGPGGAALRHWGGAGQGGEGQARGRGPRCRHPLCCLGSAANKGGCTQRVACRVAHPLPLSAGLRLSQPWQACISTCTITHPPTYPHLPTPTHPRTT